MATESNRHRSVQSPIMPEQLPTRPRWSFSLRSIFFATTALTFFFAAWAYLPMVPGYRRFWYSWSAAFLGLVIIRLAIGLWKVVRPGHIAHHP
jgi:hypothetical protein